MEQPHIQRMMAEAEELNGRIDRLGDFLDDPARMPDSIDRGLLVIQLSAMETYQAALRARINRVDAEHPVCDETEGDMA